ncbi:MAG TPA: hypothetical protein PKX18_01710 [Thermosynergistes sp.]|nr:hypothetical protein [Thermosynergistes sp.]
MVSSVSSEERRTRWDLRKVKLGVAALVFLYAALLLGLGGLRLYAMHLEFQLVSLEREIGLLSREDLKLANELVYLMSPDRIHRYACEKLKMAHANSLYVVVVPSVIQPLPKDETSILAKGEGKSASGFTAMANAED